MLAWNKNLPLPHFGTIPSRAGATSPWCSEKQCWGLDLLHSKDALKPIVLKFKISTIFSLFYFIHRLIYLHNTGLILSSALRDHSCWTWDTIWGARDQTCKCPIYPTIALAPTIYFLSYSVPAFVCYLYSLCCTKALFINHWILSIVGTWEFNF